MSDPLAHIANIGWRTGCANFLANVFDEDDSDRLRGAISAYAQDGGAGYVASTIESLFGQSHTPLSDSQVSQLGAALVDRWRE
jgi:hypothetical protein